MACISIPTTMLITGGLGAAGSLASGLIGSNAAKQAAKVQAAAATKAADQQAAQFEESKALLQPYTDAGTAGLEGVKNLLGLGSEGAEGIQSYLESLPGYQFTKEQGLQAVQNSYAAKGLGISGAALKGASEYVTGLADSTYQQQLQNFLGLTQLGEGAASSVGQMGLSSQALINQLLTGGAAATAAGIVGGTNALTAGITGATSTLSDSALLLALQKGGYFGGATGGTGVTPGSGLYSNAAGLNLAGRTM